MPEILNRFTFIVLIIYSALINVSQTNNSILLLLELRFLFSIESSGKVPTYTVVLPTNINIYFRTASQNTILIIHNLIISIISERWQHPSYQ